MTFGEPTTVDGIMDALTARLVALDLFDESQIISTLLQPNILDKFPLKDKFLAIRPGRFTARKSDQKGGGRYLFAFDGYLSVHYYSRLWTGQFISDLNALRDAENGVLVKWVEILDAWEQYCPESSTAGRSILREPMRITSFEVATRTEAKAGITRIDSTWEISFVQSLT